MTALASAISSALVHFLWQGSAVGLLFWVILAVLRKRSANSRYIAGCVALGIMALLPVATTWVLYAAGTGELESRSAATAAAGSAIASAGRQHPLLRWPLALVESWALPFWSLGVFFFSLRPVAGYQHAFRLRRRGKPAGETVLAIVDRLRKLMLVRPPIRVVISAMSEAPGVVGWLRPVILLPAATLMGLTPLQLEAILAHEIGHIKRYDYLVNMLQILVETLLFYHPAVWWASRKIRLERELCCDDLAVRFSGNALRYARALTTLEKLRLKTPGTVMASTGGPLLYRIQRLLGASASDSGPSRVPAVLALGLVVLCITLNVTWIQGQDAPGVTVDLGASSVIHRTGVQYPEAAQKQRITGTVQVEVKLDSTGNVADARVLTGPEELRKAALESVLNWHFTSDAARAARLVTISFSEQGTQQVQVREPETERTAAVNEIDRRVEEIKQESARAQEEVQALARAGLELAQASQLRELERELNLIRREVGNQDATELQQRALEARNANARAMLDKIRLGLEAIRQPAGDGRGNRSAGPGPSFVPGPGAGRRGGPGSGQAAGRVLQSISTPDLSDSVRNDLIPRLPVRAGDILTPQTIEQAGAAVRSYDEHLRVQFVLTDDGRTELRISAPVQR